MPKWNEIRFSSPEEMIDAEDTFTFSSIRGKIYQILIKQDCSLAQIVFYLESLTPDELTASEYYNQMRYLTHELDRHFGIRNLHEEKFREVSEDGQTRVYPTEGHLIYFKADKLDTLIEIVSTFDVTIDNEAKKQLHDNITVLITNHKKKLKDELETLITNGSIMEWQANTGKYPQLWLNIADYFTQSNNLAEAIKTYEKIPKENSEPEVNKRLDFMDTSIAEIYKQANFMCASIYLSHPIVISHIESNTCDLEEDVHIKRLVKALRYAANAENKNLVSRIFNELCDEGNGLSANASYLEMQINSQHADLLIHMATKFRSLNQKLKAASNNILVRENIHPSSMMELNSDNMALERPLLNQGMIETSLVARASAVGLSENSERFILPASSFILSSVHPVSSVDQTTFSSSSSSSVSSRPIISSKNSSSCPKLFSNTASRQTKVMIKAKTRELPPLTRASHRLLSNGVITRAASQLTASKSFENTSQEGLKRKRK